MSGARISVVVPAYNEEVIIGANLSVLLSHGVGKELDVVVVANGCSDQTATVAAAVSPQIRVIVLEHGSKVAALNAGQDAAEVFPIAYVDADVRVSGRTLLDLADALAADDTKLIGAPRMVVDTSRSSWLVRQSYKIWELTDYRQQSHIGSGIYVITREGRSRFGRFPDVIADDLFVLRLFQPEERLTLDEGVFVVRAPATFRAYLRRSTRIVAGNRQLADRGLSGEPSRGGTASLVRRVLRRPRLWLAFPVYILGYSLPRLPARRPQTISWNRDDTTRVDP